MRLSERWNTYKDFLNAFEKILQISVFNLTKHTDLKSEL